LMTPALTTRISRGPIVGSAPIADEHLGRG
jgi:hypothetical protein